MAPGNPSGELRPLDNAPWPSLDDAVALEVTAGLGPHEVDPRTGPASRSGSIDRGRLARQALTMHVSDISANWSAKNWLQRPRLGYFRL